MPGQSLNSRTAGSNQQATQNKYQPHKPTSRAPESSTRYALDQLQEGPQIQEHNQYQEALQFPSDLCRIPSLPSTLQAHPPFQISLQNNPKAPTLVPRQSCENLAASVTMPLPPTLQISHPTGLFAPYDIPLHDPTRRLSRSMSRDPCENSAASGKSKATTLSPTSLTQNSKKRPTSKTPPSRKQKPKKKSPGYVIGMSRAHSGATSPESSSRPAIRERIGLPRAHTDPSNSFSGQERINVNSIPLRNKKSLNVDSPAFTPATATLSVPTKTSTISSQAANAAPFTPRGLVSGTTTPSTQPDPEPVTFNPAQIKEFTPAQSFDLTQTLAANGTTADPQVSYDPFSMNALNQTIPAASYNPYLEDTTNATNNGGAFYQAQPAFSSPAQPLQYHLYAPIGPHREDLLAYQRLAHDFFIPNDLREELQKKSEASLQVMQNSQLPAVDHFHTLVPLDTNHNKSATVFGFPSWVYKAVNSKNGKVYVLRRLEGFRLSNERAMRVTKDWRRVDNAGVVSVVDAFTTRVFGDSSLIFVYDYFPMSKTLVEHHFNSTNRFGNRTPHTIIPEQVLWSYIVQIASAIKSIHETKLAVRCVDASKVLLTEKNRIRLNACSVLDVVNFEANRPLADLQQEDFIHFGKLILALATNNLSSSIALKTSVENLTRTYSSEFKDTITWLLTPAQLPSVKTIEEFLSGISKHIIASYDSSLHSKDDLTSTLSRELENGRLFRLMAKLGAINERPEYEGDVKWSEVGERYVLKLFRDYVFHRVDANGKPVVDMGWVVGCLNKLDAGVTEKIELVSRDEQDVFVVSYREVRKLVEGAWGELLKEGRGGKRF